MIANLRTIREHRRMSQYELARRVRRSQPFISQVERGYLIATGEDIAAIAAALEVSIATLMTAGAVRVIVTGIEEQVHV